MSDPKRFELRQTRNHWRSGKTKICNVEVKAEKTGQTTVKYCVPVSAADYQDGKRASVRYGFVTQQTSDWVQFIPCTELDYKLAKA